MHEVTGMEARLVHVNSIGEMPGKNNTVENRAVTNPFYIKQLSDSEIPGRLRCNAWNKCGERLLKFPFKFGGERLNYTSKYSYLNHNERTFEGTGTLNNVLKHR